MYPFRFDKVDQFGPFYTVSDLDFDGSDEIIYRISPTSPRANEAWMLESSDGQTIDEISIPGHVLGPPSAVDLDGDGVEKEVLFAVNRNDSLFVYAFENDASSVGAPMMIAHGGKRIDPNGTVYNWEAEALFLMLDVDGDGASELVTVINSTHAGLPRGLTVHNPRTGELLGEFMSGAAFIRPLLIDDVDSDGKLEMVVATAVPGHGADENGFDDSSGHLIVFELGLQPKVEWSETVAVPQTHFLAFTGHFRDDVSHELVAMSAAHRTITPMESVVTFYNLEQPRNEQTPTEIPFPGIVEAAGVTDLDGNGLDEIYILTGAGDILCLDQGEYSSLSSYDARFMQVQAFPDVTGDGVGEFALHTTDDRTLLMSKGRKIISVDDENGFTGDVLHLPGGEIRYLTGTGGAYTLKRSSAYLLYRYRDDAGIFFALLASLLLIGFAHRTGKTAGSRTSHDTEIDLFHECVSSMFSGADDVRKHALLVLEKHFREANFDVAQWASETGYNSPRQLQRVVKDVTGQTPEQLLWLRRINEGHRLLTKKGNRLSVSEIAFQVGFKEHSHFTRKYRDVFGVPPSVSKG